MSDPSPTQSLSKQISGHWQVPLVVFSVVMLLVGIWRMRARPAPPTFEELLNNAVGLADAGFYPEASEYTTMLLEAPARLPEERRQLHRLMARIIFEHELGNAVHGAGNARAILEHSNAGLAEGESHDAETHRMQAMALEWLRRPTEALAEYQEAVAKGLEGAWEIRKRILEIRQSTGGAPAGEFHTSYEAFLTEPGVSDELRYWAAEQAVDLFGRQGEHKEAERFLSLHAGVFEDSAFRGRYDYLQALAWFHAGRRDDSERLLRALRDRLSEADPLYACSGWLLGRILQIQESPEFALSFYDDVLDKTPAGPYRTASLLGRAEALAGLERFDESVEAYTKVIRLTTDDPYGALVDLSGVRESTTGRYQELLASGRLEVAMAYLRIAAKLVPPADWEKQAVYSERLADLAFALGKAASARASLAEAPEGAGLQARAYLLESGRHYLRLAKLVSLDGERSSEATWRAADAFDEGGDRARVAEVLEKFIRERPTGNRVPKALHRLGQTYQALGEFDKAIARYQQNLVQFPGTFSAVASLVPLADCFIEVGEVEKAEKTLLRLVSHRPDESLRSVTPAARDYKEALFRLGDLYSGSGEYEKAIARYEEVLERYGDDSRANRATFMLAEAYRRSAVRIRVDLRDSKNVAYKDHLRATHQERLRRARESYGEVIDRCRSRPPSAPAGADQRSELDQLYMKLSHLYRADVVYDLSRVSASSDLGCYAEALELYDRAAWFYQNDPVAMSAYVQMINCHLRMGNADKARMTLQRAKWALKGIPGEAFVHYAPDEDHAYWEHYLSWLERTPTLAVAGMTAPG